VVGLLILAAVLLSPLIFATQRQKPEKSRTSVAGAQDIESKLARKADFVPSDKSTLDRLVAIAQHYEIPMGIEWIGGTGSQELQVPSPQRPDGYTVRDLLSAIVARLPDYQMTVENGVVHIAPPVVAVRTDNFLNLIIEEFQVENENLFGAQHELKLSIDMTLHPDEYEDGYAGGYGYAPDHVFAKRKFSFKSDDTSVREILDGLIKANGNALWIAEFDPEQFKAGSKSNVPGKKKDKRQDKAMLKYEWRFVPLNEKL